MVSIQICQGLWGKVTIINADTKEELWKGKSGELAKFEVSADTPIHIIWGIFQTPNVSETVSDGKEYEVIFRMTPFAAKYFLVPKED